MTHNLEVPGSSPGWSTLIIKHLRVSRKCFFHVYVKTYITFVATQTDLLLSLHF